MQHCLMSINNPRSTPKSNRTRFVHMKMGVIVLSTVGQLSTEIKDKPVCAGHSGEGLDY